MKLVPALAEATAGQLSDAQRAAANWLINAHLCGRLLARPDAERVLVMDGRCVVSDPQHAVLAVAEHFGLASDDIRTSLVKLRPSTRHAKSRGKAYDGAMLAADLASAERACGEDVEAAIAWARRLCPELVGVFECVRGRTNARRFAAPIV